MKVPDKGEDNFLAIEKQWKSLHQNRDLIDVTTPEK